MILTQRLRSEGDAPSSFLQPQIDESTSETFPPETFHEQRNYIHIQYIYIIYILYPVRGFAFDTINIFVSSTL